MEKIKQKLKSFKNFISRLPSNILNWLINHRKTFVFLSALIGIALSAFVYCLILNTQNQSSFTEIAKGAGFWNLIIVILGAPVAFVIWIYRDLNNTHQIENQRKDTNLKDFHKLTEWVAGLHILEDKITDTTKTTKAASKLGSEQTKTTETYSTPKDSNFVTISKRWCSSSASCGCISTAILFRGRIWRVF